MDKGHPSAFPEMMAIMGQKEVACGSTNLDYFPSKLYDLDGFTVNELGKSVVRVNGLARALIWDKLQRNAKDWLPRVTGSEFDHEFDF